MGVSKIERLYRVTKFNKTGTTDSGGYLRISSNPWQILSALDADGAYIVLPCLLLNDGDLQAYVKVLNKWTLEKVSNQAVNLIVWYVVT